MIIDFEVVFEGRVGRIVSDLKEATMQSDRYCMSPVVRLQFDQNIPDMALNGVLANMQAVRNDFV
jgi:hypothetical protein